MIHEHDALLLASAALDFELDPAAREELREALAECPVCAERAAAYGDQGRLLARLPEVEVSEATRRRVTSAALAGRVESRPPMLLLAAALLLGLLLAMAAVAGALRDEPGPNELGKGDETPAPSPAAAAASPVAASASPPAGSGTTGGGSTGDLAPDSIVEVVSVNLRVRSAPRVASDSIRLEPLLDIGDRLFVIQGPVVANDYSWYEVAPVGTDPERPWTGLPGGWIARGDHDGTPWVAAVAPACPAEPAEIAALGAMHPLERLACFGATPLAFRAVVEGSLPVACDDRAAADECGPGPTFLAGNGGWQAAVRTGPGTGSLTSGPHLAIDPAGPVRPADLAAGRVVALRGSFDHPDAARCEAPVTPAGQAAPSREAAVLRCRSRFVVSGAVVASQHLVPDSAAITVTDNLRVRSLPFVADDSIRLSPLLDRGTHLYVLDGPSVGSGYDWYKVVVPSIATDGGGLLAGWVAVGGKDGEAWASSEAIGCPSPGDVTVDDVAALTADPIPHAGLACFGREAAASGPTLTFDARVRLECDRPAPSAAADWLMADDRTVVLIGDGRELRATAHASATLPVACDTPSNGRTYVIEGHFDDAAAGGCRAAAGAAGGIADDVAVYRCRTRFVVARIDSRVR